MRLPSLAVVALLSAGALLAQDPNQGFPGQASPGQDPPSRVARLNFIDGNVSFQPASLDTWTAANLNYPLTTGDHIYADAGSHAEMQIGPNVLRVGSQSNVGFLNLDDQTVQVRFTEGALEIRLRQLADNELYEIDTPQGAISLLRTGDYRIDTDPNRNATMVTVRGGEAEVTANGNSFAVHPNQTAFFADAGQPDIRIMNPPDDFDSFVSNLNMSEDRVPPPVHVPPTMVGYQDLDANGVWRNDPGYGWVWAPRVRAGWAPYHEGHWAWVEPWGWTWIDEAPWGFAPFHYGRWANLGGVWVWMPGTVVARPVYSPALVAFVGGSAFGVAWFPLGPREPFYPAYRVSNVYVRQVNITQVNVTNINVTNVRYVNQTVPGAVVAVPQGAFVSARSVGAVARPLSAQEVSRAQVVTSAQVAPQRESVLGNARVNAAVPHPSQEIMARQVVAKSTPPPPTVSFAAKQQMLQANQGRPLAAEQVQQIRAQQPAASTYRPPLRATTAPGAVPVAPPPPPVNRMDSRPPTARPDQPGSRRGYGSAGSARPVEAGRLRYRRIGPLRSPARQKPAPPRRTKRERPLTTEPTIRRPRRRSPNIWSQRDFHSVVRHSEPAVRSSVT